MGPGVIDGLRLTALIHGDSGVGKSWLGASAPGPRLIIDAEQRGSYTPGNKVRWNPREAPPADLTQDTSVIVTIRDFSDLKLTYDWLASGKHQFASVIIDSLTEVQQRLVDSIAGANQMQTQDWGTALRELESYVRKFRDLREHPSNPLWAIVVLAGSHEKNGKQRPMLNGQLSSKVAYHYDLVGYLDNDLDGAGEIVRRMLIRPIGLYQAKDNTHILGQHYGHYIFNPNISDMLRVLNTPVAPAAGSLVPTVEV